MIKNRNIVVSADMNKTRGEKHGKTKHDKEKKKSSHHHHRHHRQQGKPGELIETKRHPASNEIVDVRTSHTSHNAHKQTTPRIAPLKIETKESLPTFPKFSFDTAIFDKSAELPVFTDKPETIVIARAFIPPENKQDPSIKYANLISCVVSWETVAPEEELDSFTEMCFEISVLRNEPGKAPPAGIVGSAKEIILYRTNDSATDGVCPSRTTHFQFVHKLDTSPGRAVPIWYKIQAFVKTQGMTAKLKDQTPVSWFVMLQEFKE